MSVETRCPAAQNAEVLIRQLRPVTAHLGALADVHDRGISSHDAQVTWAEAVDAARRVATMFRSAGVGRGDVVVGVLDNCTQGLLAWWGANLLGATWAPLNTGLDREGLETQMRTLVPAAVVTDPQHEAEVRPPAGDLPTYAIGAGFLAYRDYAPLAEEPVDLADPALVLFSSGTTGRAKACLIGHGYLANYSRLGMQNVPRERDDVLWTPLPLFHLAGLGHVIQSMMVGGSVVLPPRFSVSRFWDDVTAAGATFVALMSSMIPRIARASYERAPMHGVHTVTGEPFPPELQRLWRERFGGVRTGSVALGQTEAGFLTTLRGHEPRPGTCGLPTDSFEVFVVDDTGAPVPVGHTGELVVRPRHRYAMFDGYLGAEPHGVTPGGEKVWHTGDYVRQDDDGYVYFVDRGTDRIRKGGENIASALIETVAVEYHGVAQAAAVALPAEADDDILLVVTPAGDVAIDLVDLAEWLRMRLPSFGMPDHIDIVAELPTNASSKVLKHALRSRGLTPTAWRTPR